MGSTYSHLMQGTVYKPRRQVKGEGVAQMSTLLNKSYLVKVSTKGEGGQNAPNSVYMVCTQPLMFLANSVFNPNSRFISLIK